MTCLPGGATRAGADPGPGDGTGETPAERRRLGTRRPDTRFERGDGLYRAPAGQPQLERRTARPRPQGPGSVQPPPPESAGHHPGFGGTRHEPAETTAGRASVWWIAADRGPPV